MLRTLIVDDEPLAIERMQVLCAEIPQLRVVGTASDGDSALRLSEKLNPDLLLLDMTMPGKDGLQVAREAGSLDSPPAVIFVTAHENFAVEAFDLEAIDYVLKPVAGDRLERAIERALARRDRNGEDSAEDSQWLTEFWVPHRSELLRIDASEVYRIDAERDYVRLHVGETSYLLLQTIAGLEEKLDPDKFIRIHRSTILRKDFIAGLRHEGLGVWCAELADGEELRIGRTYLKKVKAMAGR
ncbi:LytR/AlgR family response regulator transcription factor [Aurantiacibacter poecillastricola]|uniref:LytR/AlgR family response regulator transcription factor n=1 Tax=Aurantiacibacter poecillastricola TaxID=3064385 RepID=UPI00273F9D17|nr:LytTR family DNA-binding domain-containing protein [Aurantiacibacter sp. 219JJ12-13]MDP5260527.1 LytTR family DNA-binding domain-containing protein [Aurantiacibacter sp. 219JJ12-13]